MGIRYPFGIKHLFNPGVAWRKSRTELFSISKQTTCEKCTLKQLILAQTLSNIVFNQTIKAFFLR